jgi:hypothetical protein
VPAKLGTKPNMIFSKLKNIIRLKKISLFLGIFLALSTSLVIPLRANAAYDSSQPASSSNYDPGDVQSCSTGQIGTCTRINPTDKSTTTCTLHILRNADCTVTFPDNQTQVSTTGNVLIGATINNKDASGNTVSTSTTGGVAGFVGNGASGVGSAIVSTLAGIAYYLMSAAGYLLGLVGEVFNWVIVITVFQFASYFANSAGMLAAWGILRDVGNICILFGFIYIGITIILDINGDASRKALPRLLIFAALMNFSLFAGEAVIDVANVLSATLYTQAGSSTFAAANTTNNSQVLGGVNGASSATVSSGQNNVQVGIAGLIMQDTGTGTAFSPTTKPNTSTGYLYAYIGTTIFILVTMAVLLAGTIIFAIRAVLLCVLLIISPLGFAAMAIPQFQERGKQWWSMLLQNAFFAPVFLLLIFAGLKIMEAARTSLDAGSSSKTLADALAAPGSSTGGVLIVFMLTTGFMIAAFQFARSSSVIGGQFATNFAQKTVTGVAKAPFRIASTPVRIGARQGVGKLGSSVGKNWDSWAGQAREGKKGTLAKGLALTARGIGIDEGIEHGTQAMQKVKFGTKRSYEEEKKFTAERTKHLAHAGEMAHLNENLKTGIKPGATQDEKDQAERALQKMSQADIENAIKNTKDAKSIETISQLLSSDKFEKAMESKELNAQMQEQLIDGRFGGEGNDNLAAAQKEYAATQSNPASTAIQRKDAFNKLKGKVQALSGKDAKLLARYSTDLYSNVAGVTDATTGESVWRNDQIDNIVKDDSLTRSQRGKVFSAKRSEQLKTQINSGAPSTVEIIKLVSNMNKDIADVPANVLTNDHVIDNLNMTHIAAIMGKGELNSQADKDKIMNRIKSNYSEDPQSQYQLVRRYLDKNGGAATWWGTVPFPEKIPPK